VFERTSREGLQDGHDAQGSEEGGCRCCPLLQSGQNRAGVETATLVM
jgi:hypothetical protein